jgi:DNA-binding XRE family transcriptional regulator
MEDMKFYTHEEMLDKVIGMKGTPERDKHEEEVQFFLIGEAVKQARESKNLTQEELGNLIGVQRAQISRIESGKNLTFSTIAKVFKAMNISAQLEIGNLGRVALW